MSFAKWFLYLGLAFIGISLLIFLFSKLGISLGKLPGDLSIKGEKYRVYFPIVTSIVISLILTVLLNLFFYFFRK